MLASAVAVDAATLTVDADALVFTENVDGVGVVRIEFANCMANNLYTFKSVSIDGAVLNLTDSDNIGPFLISSGWTGGNHVNHDAKSAKTVSVSVKVDGAEISREESGKYDNCRVVDIEVVNELYKPGAEPDIFATETMSYRVAGNSIDVTARHEYKTAVAERIDRYYGMQSMFIGETEILTPGGAYSRWTPVAEVNRFTKKSAPRFTTFVEHSDRGYQATYMTRDGLGDRHMVADDDWVFIGNSYSKSYHKLIGDRTVKAGDETLWHGVYTWFTRPVVDECGSAEDSGTFIYKGFLNGEETLFSLDSDGTVRTVAVNATPPCHCLKK